MTRVPGTAHTAQRAPDDVALRNETYRLFVASGRAPSAEETASATRSTASEVRAGRVRADNRWWYANCAWDAFGVLAALHCDGQIAASCPDCGEPAEIAVQDERPHDDSLLFHCLVPAARWWDDIVFT